MRSPHTPLHSRSTGPVLVALGALLFVAAQACSSDEQTAQSDGTNSGISFGDMESGTANATNAGGNNNSPSTVDPSSNPGAANGVTENGPNATGLDGAGGSAVSAGTGGSTMEGGAAGTAMSDVPPGPVNGYHENGAWRGYAFAEPVGAGTTITPTDFTTLPPGDPFCVSGTVGPDPAYGGVSLLGFSINQERLGIDGAPPAELTTTPTGTGIAVNFQKQLASILRIQIQGPTGNTNEDDRWCYEIEDVTGPIFAPYSEFNTRCFGVEGDLNNPRGNDYAGEPLSAVIFTVPGSNLLPVDFDYCVDGFADGNSIADAPEDSGAASGPLTGTLAENFRRAKVLSPDGKSYVVQNNAWNAGAQQGAQQLAFSGNSFTVTRQTNPDFGNIPISFPSIFIGHNGSPLTSNSLATSNDDNLPRRLGDVNSVQSTFNHNGGSVAGDYNATYDIWFANNVPTADYDDAEAAFLMVWLHKPRQNPIGLNPMFTNQTVAGVAGTWDIWVGNRGENGAEDNLNDNAPVISYLPSGGGTINNFSADLKNFMNDAVSRNIGLNNNLILTDVFGGFEIWNGGTNLQLSEFTAVVE